jgi:[acyl-carrier-protein] S-malonyltransferase
MRRELISQLTSPVRWTASVRYMVARGVTRFLEIGPKDVLAGLIRRIAPEVAVLSIGDMAGIEAFCAV